MDKKTNCRKEQTLPDQSQSVMFACAPHLGGSKLTHTHFDRRMSTSYTRSPCQIHWNLVTQAYISFLRLLNAKKVLVFKDLRVWMETIICTVVHEGSEWEPGNHVDNSGKQAELELFQCAEVAQTCRACSWGDSLLPSYDKLSLAVGGYFRCLNSALYLVFLVLC